RFQPLPEDIELARIFALDQPANVQLPAFADDLHAKAEPAAEVLFETGRELRDERMQRESDAGVRHRASFEIPVGFSVELEILLHPFRKSEHRRGKKKQRPQHEEQRASVARMTTLN